MPYIDRNKLIKTIEDMPNCYNGFSDTFDKACIIGLIEEQPTVEIPRWIPCEERLPEKPFGCLVTVMDTDPITMEEFENILPYFVGYDGEQWNDAEGLQCPFEVIAWQPLPDPYREESEDD